MRIQVGCDRPYKREEPVWWRGNKVGWVSYYEGGVADVEVPQATLTKLQKTQAQRFIMKRGKLVEVYELRKAP